MPNFIFWCSLTVGFFLISLGLGAFFTKKSQARDFHSLFSLEHAVMVNSITRPTLPKVASWFFIKRLPQS